MTTTQQQKILAQKSFLTILKYTNLVKDRDGNLILRDNHESPREFEEGSFVFGQDSCQWPCESQCRYCDE